MKAYHYDIMTYTVQAYTFLMIVSEGYK